MKFFRMFESRLMNEAAEMIDAGGGDGVDFSDDTADYNDDDSNDPIDAPIEDSFKALGLDPNKYGLEESSKNESPDEDSQGSEDDAKDAGPKTDESAFLERLNSLGAIHNELPFKVESVDEVKNLMQMGKDYTVKTQALSEDRKSFESEKSSTQAELNTAIDEFNASVKQHDQVIQESQSWHFALKNLEKNNPEIFEIVQEAYNGVTEQFNNPIINQQFDSLRAELAEAKKGLAQREDKLIVDSFESDYAKQAATEQSMKELGITIDKEAVKKEWAATGLPVNKVIGAMYFENVAKAQASKSKVASTKAKVTNAKPTGSAASSRPGSKVPQIDRKLSYLQQAQELYKNMK